MDDTPLSTQQLAQLSHALSERRRQLRADIRQALLKSDDERYIELAGRVHDLEEASVADLLVDLNYAVIDHQLAELHEVEDALERMAAGNYGICVTCGGPIGWPRLQACPEASRCLPCQEQYEKTYRQPGTPRL